MSESKPSTPKESRYYDATDVQEIAKKLIDTTHQHLKGVPIAYLFNTGNMRAWATMQLLGDKQQTLSGYTFCMEVNRKKWGELSDEHRIAVVDHELCHAGMVDGKPVMIEHDLEEFACIVKRHGLWRDDVKAFAVVVQEQLEFIVAPLKSPSKSEPSSSKKAALLSTEKKSSSTPSKRKGRPS